MRHFIQVVVASALGLATHHACVASQLTTAGRAAQLDIRAAGKHGIRITLKPLSFEGEFPFNPALAEGPQSAPVISVREMSGPVRKQVGNLRVEVHLEPLRLMIATTNGEPVQDIEFDAQGNLVFQHLDQPVLGLGEGGPVPGRDWRNKQIEFDRRGRLHEMRPRWQSNAYGSRNPVPFLIGTAGWALYVATPWVSVDLEGNDGGRLIPWKPPDPPDTQGHEMSGQAWRDYTAQIQGRPPVESVQSGVYDFFVFDARDPVRFMRDVSTLTGPAVMPPKWALGYMQSHRTLEDENQLTEIVRTFRRKEIPLDAVIYLGTGFCPRGWNTRQPSFDFNPEFFKRSPSETINDLQQLNVRVAVHIVPWPRDRLPTLHGTLPPREGEVLDSSHILNYWKQHLALVNAGIDAWWPDEGDWFNLFERMKRHQLYYQGPLWTRPNVRPWSLHRNGYFGVAKWGGWIWSGDTDSSWKTLEGQIAVGLNHSLSLSPFWGSDIGGFYPNEELTGELYARWFQFASFCPSFRSHGRTWWTRLPWGWGLHAMGPKENQRNPLESELNNPAIEPVCRKYGMLRYRLMPYTYTLAWEARETGMPLMRALWLHYPADERARGLGSQYLWGRDLLVAPVFSKGATSREVYLPEGEWYDWWTNGKVTGGRSVSRKVDLATLPIYVRAGAIIPLDPVRQYTGQVVDEPTTLRVYRGADGEFTLYEDDGISLDYLQGRATRTRFSWDDSAERLVMEPVVPARATDSDSHREFKVEVIPGGASRSVSYTGRRVVVEL